MASVNVPIHFSYYSIPSTTLKTSFSSSVLETVWLTYWLFPIILPIEVAAGDVAVGITEDGLYTTTQSIDFYEGTDPSSGVIENILEVIFHLNFPAAFPLFVSFTISLVVISTLSSVNPILNCVLDNSILTNSILATT